MCIKLRYNWIEDYSSSDSFVKHTMASLIINVNDEIIITNVWDQQKRMNRNHIIVPLVVLSEWLAINWWYIFNETEDDIIRQVDFDSRHNLKFAGDGFIFPNLNFISISEQKIQISWSPYKPKYAGIEFVTDNGRIVIEKDNLKLEFCNLINDTIKRLKDNDIISEILEEYWENNYK